MGEVVRRLEDIVSSNEKFAFYPVLSLPTGISIEHPDIDLGGGVRLCINVQPKIDEGWQAEFGRLRLQNFEKSPAVVVAQKKTDSPNVSNQEEEELHAVISAVHFALSLFTRERIRNLSSVPAIAGSWRNGSLSYHAYRELRMVYSFGEEYSPLPGTTAEQIQRAYRGYTELDTVFRQTGEYARFWRGFRAWLKGVRSVAPEDRAHQFVRALDALIKTPRSKAQEMFKKQERLLVKSDMVQGRFMDDLYDLRSAVEHVNDWQDFLKRKEPNRTTSETNARAIWLTIHSERLTAHLYAEILSNKNLRKNFATDESIVEFWPGDEAPALLPMPLDVGNVPKKLLQKSRARGQKAGK